MKVERSRLFPKSLRKTAERAPSGIAHVVTGAQVHDLPGLEGEHRLGALVVAVEGDLLLERHPLRWATAISRPTEPSGLASLIS